MLAKLIAMFAAALILTVPVGSQQPCSRGLTNAPALFGFRLGMSFDDVRSILGPTIKFWKKPPKNGEGIFFQNFIEEPPSNTLSGVRALYLRFFNNKLYQVEIFYEDKDRPTKLSDFTNRLSRQIDLPTDSWSIKNGQAAINCGDFMLTADTILNRHVELTDDAADQAFKKERQKQKKPSKKKN
jgi:hypothetical protein